jgi:hypothetical protein
MWTERPRPLWDGLLVATMIAIGLCSILSIWSVDAAKPAPTVKCQEVVALVEPRGHVLAQCPTGTYIEIIDENVVCRCGTRRQPTSIEVDPPEFFMPQPNQTLPNAEPPNFGDQHGIEL